MTRRTLTRLLTHGTAFIAGILTLFLATLATRPRAPGPNEPTDLGQSILVQLDPRLEWHAAGPERDGLSLWEHQPGEPAHEPAVLSVLPDDAAESRVRVYLGGVEISDRLSPADHAALRQALTRQTR